MILPPYREFVANFAVVAYVFPPTESTMNYNSVILVGVVVLTTAWWFIHGMRKYPGPKLSHLYVNGKIVELPNAKTEHSE